MSFWTSQGDETTTLRDPKRKFRFIVTITGFNSDGGVQWWAKTAAKPSFTIGAAEHKYLNHTFYYPGGTTWNDVAITLVDPVNPDVGFTLADIIETAGYKPPANAVDQNERATMTKASAVSTLGTVTVEQLAGDGSAVETWTLNNAWISELKFGDLEYGSDDLTEVTMTLKYDWATMGTSEESDATSGTVTGEAFSLTS